MFQKILQMKKFIQITIPMLFAGMFWSCDKDLLNTIPDDRVTSAIFWTTDQDAVLAANAIYTKLPNADVFTNWDAMSDIGHVTLGWRDQSIMEKGAYDATIAPVLTTWNTNYAAIQAANIFLGNVDNINANDPGLISNLKGQVKVLRAYFYINLAELFGDVPLITSEISLEESRKVTRTPVNEVWDFISKELLEAADLLPVTQTEKGRITKGAALSLEARAMLSAHRYQDAADAAKKVIDLGVYKLYPSYQKLFSYEAENNEEVIFDKQFIKNVQSNNIFALSTPNSVFPQVNSFVPTKNAVDAYEMTNGKDITDPASGFDPKNPYKNRDPRLRYSIFVLGDTLPNGKIYDSRPGSGTADGIGFSENTTATGFNVRKYVNKDDMADPNNCGINIIYLRYAEVLLIYAEAKIELNQIDQSVVDAINAVRQRPDVHMPPVSLASKDDMLKIVRHERLVELAFEGLRYFDIRRWRIAEDVIPGIIQGMTYINDEGKLVTIAITGFLKVFDKNRDYLWPIPQTERLMNPSLTQNPGW